jgi:hypothetical protein
MIRAGLPERRPFKNVHVARQELERKFEIVLLAENALMGMKSSANESCYLLRNPTPVYIAIRAKLKEK